MNIVKTVTKSISLHQELADFADREAEAGCFGNVSAYFAELLRKARVLGNLPVEARIYRHSTHGPGRAASVADADYQE